MKIFTPLFLIALFFTSSCTKPGQPAPVQLVSNKPKEIIFNNYAYGNNGKIENNVKLILTWKQDQALKIDWYRKNKDTDYYFWFTEDKTNSISAGYEYEIKYEYDNGKLSKTTRTDSPWGDVEEISYTNYLNEVPLQIHAVSKNSETEDIIYSQRDYSLSFDQNGNIQMASCQYSYGNSFNPLKGLLGELPAFSIWYSDMGSFDPVWYFSKRNPVSLVINGNAYYQFEYIYDQNNRPINIKTYNTDKSGATKTLNRDIRIKY